MEKGGTGECTGPSPREGGACTPRRWEQHQEKATQRSRGPHPGAPHRCGQHPLTQPVSEARDIRGVSSLIRNMPSAHEGSFSESSERRCDGHRGTWKQEASPKGQSSAEKGSAQPGTEAPHVACSFSFSTHLSKFGGCRSGAILCPHVCPFTKAAAPHFLILKRGDP